MSKPRPSRPHASIPQAYRLIRQTVASLRDIASPSWRSLVVPGMGKRAGLAGRTAGGVGEANQ